MPHPAPLGEAQSGGGGGGAAAGGRKGGCALEPQACLDLQFDDAGERIAQKLKESLLESFLASLEERLAAAEENIVRRLQAQNQEKHLDAASGVSADMLRHYKQQSSADSHKESKRSLCIVAEEASHGSFQCDPEQHDRYRRKEASTFGKLYTSTVEVEEDERSPVGRLVHNSRFEAFLSMVIIMNAVFIGVETDLLANGVVSDEHIGIAIARYTFTAAFTFELCLRIAGDGRRFFAKSDSMLWNYFDLVVVVTSLVEVALELLVYFDRMTSGTTQGTTQFRILRFLRMTRLIRGIRVTRLIRVLRALRILVYQIASTVKSLFWALLLLSLIIYLFAILFTQATTVHRESMAGGLTAIPHGSSEDPLFTYWSTVPRSAFTLFKAITGGVSWEEVVKPLSKIDWTWVVIFIIYISFAQMAVLNVLTGVFCQNAIDSAAHDQDLQVQAILLEKQNYLREINDIFMKIDTDQTGTITLQEFQQSLEDETMSAHLEALGLDTSEVWTLFKLMDMDSGNMIDLNEFVYGCLRLKGNAKSVDLAKLSHEQKWLAKRMNMFMQRTDKALCLLTAQMTS